MTSESSWSAGRKNADVPWGLFDPIIYVDHNYRSVLAEDAEILRVVSDHFAGHFSGHVHGPITGIDVGAGPNLYPALTMLPWCEEITLLERSPANVRYLKGQVADYDANWDVFWEVLCENQAYRHCDSDPRAKAGRVMRVRQGDLFSLGQHQEKWSLGTMFFVAEAMTTSYCEFAFGIERFLCALTPGAPFAAAFMEHSLGYQVGEHHFPACDVGEAEVRASVERFAGDFKVESITSSAWGRDGYSGMILAYGRRRK
ncbi:SCO2525 family SAM-dependent methyltransferase [Streptomyces massasporeus]